MENKATADDLTCTAPWRCLTRTLRRVDASSFGFCHITLSVTSEHSTYEYGIGHHDRVCIAQRSGHKVTKLKVMDSCADSFDS